MVHTDQDPPSLRRRVGNGLSWTALGKFSGQIFSWASTLIVIRLLSPTDYGLISMAAVFISFCAMLNEFGLGMALVQKKEIDDLTKRQVWTIAIFLNIALVVLFYFAAYPISSFYGEPLLVTLVQVMALQFVIRAFSVVPRSLLIREMRFKEIAVIDFFAQFANAATTLLLAYFSFGYWSLIIGSMIEGVLKIPALLYVSGFKLQLTTNTQRLKSLLGIGSAFSINRVLWFIYSEVDKLLVGKLLGADRLGFYSIGTQLASLPLEKSGAIINQVAFPAYATLQSTPERAYAAYLKTVQLMLFLFVPICLGIAAIADEAVRVVLGPDWIDSAVPLALISLITPLKLVGVSYNNLLIGIGRVWLVTRNLALACVLIPAGLFIGARHGITGVSVAWVLSYTLWFSIAHIRVATHLQWRILDELKAIITPYIIGSIMLILLDLVFAKFSFYTDSNITTLVQKVILGIALYSSLWLLWDPKRLRTYRSEIVSFFR